MRTKWMLRQRNLTIFPNLQIIDISSAQLRTWRPLAPDKTEMVSYCLAPVGESAAARTLRIRNYEDFFNASGLATSDDNVMYELCQTGYEATSAGPTQGYLRGAAQPGTGRFQHSDAGAPGATPAVRVGDRFWVCTRSHHRPDQQGQWADHRHAGVSPSRQRRCASRAGRDRRRRAAFDRRRP